MSGGSRVWYARMQASMHARGPGGWILDLDRSRSSGFRFDCIRTVQLENRLTVTVAVSVCVCADSGQNTRSVASDEYTGYELYIGTDIYIDLRILIIVL